MVIQFRRAFCTGGSASFRRQQKFARHRRRQFHRHKVFRRIEIVFAGFVDHTHMAFPRGHPVWQDLINLSRF
jgi:hypothetical protein